jgi:hypothetical protein
MRQRRVFVRQPAGPRRNPPACAAAARLCTRAVILLMVTVLIVCCGLLHPKPSGAAAPAISQKKGFDTCATPSHQAMADFWTGTVASTWFVYIGGSSVGCTPTTTASWMSQELNRGWRILPIWVGRQASCTGFASRMSSDASTAYSQGQTAGSNAYSELLNLGIGTSPVVYDLEGFDASNSTCLAAAKAYMRGWASQLHLGTPNKAGLYTSAGVLDNFSGIAPAPDFVWGGNPGSGSHTTHIDYVSDSHWTQNQRHKQYTAGTNVTAGSTTLFVDRDCSNGPVESAYGNTSTDSDCI